MEILISKTMEIARQHFGGFGFNEDQIAKLLESGNRDLEIELSTLQELLQQENYNLEDIDFSLHALKGLLMNMGNVDVANKLNELRQEKAKNDTIDIDAIKASLYL